MYNCITIGDIKLDTFAVLDDASVECQLRQPGCFLCLEYGKKIPVKDIDVQIAGSAPNVSVGLARMKLKSAVFSMMGKDAIYNMALEKMKKENVGTQYIKPLANKKSSFAVVLNYKGEKTILAAHEPYEYHLPKLAKTKWVYVCELGSEYKKLYTELIKKVTSDHTHIAINPGAFQVEEQHNILYDLMKKTTLLFLNLGEARALTNLGPTAQPQDIVAAAWHLNEKQVVVTDGRNGAYGFDGEAMIFLPMFPGERVEATGAGDSFACGTLAAIMKGMKLFEAMRWGAVNSASVVQFVGPTAGLLSTTEIKKRLAAHPSFKPKKL